MITINNEILPNIRNSPETYKIRIELLFSIIFNYFCDGDYIIGNNYPKPDLLNLKTNEGFEITQCDEEQDLDGKYIFEFIIKNENGTIEQLESFLSKYHKKVSLSKYRLGLNKDGYVQSYSPKGESNYLKAFSKVVLNKCKKNNKGNYKYCEKVSLIIGSICRYKQHWQVENAYEKYKLFEKDFKVKFKKLYLLTTTFFYVFEDNSLLYYELPEDIYNKSVCFVNKLVDKITNGEEFTSLYWDKNDLFII